MLGERYFAARERLSGVMHGIVSLAEDTATEIHDKLPLAVLSKGLGNPFLFLVCGEVNAGKSTLINGLFGRDLCRVHNLPETSRVFWYRHADRAEDVEMTPILEERYRPYDFLRDFQVIDTPGTNSAIKGHQAVSQRFFHSADLIFFVFPVTNPWTAATWDLIAKLPEEAVGRAVLIIQQADQRELKDIEVILGHMRDLSMKRSGRVLPIFAVSGKMAFEAKRVASRSRLKESGYPVLEDFISSHVCQSRERRASLETWRAQSASALLAIEDRIEEQGRNLRAQDRFLDEIEGEIDDIRERFVNRLSQHLSGVAEVFQTEAVWVSKTLRKRLSSVRSILRLFLGDRSGPEMESLFVERLQRTIESVAEIDANEVVEACRRHWNELAGRVQETIGVDLANSHPIDQTLSTARDRFTQRLASVARQGIGNLKVRHQLDKMLRRRNVALTSFTFMTLAFLAAGGICGALMIAWLPQIFCGIAGLFFIGGLLTAWATRRRIVDDFRDRLLDTCGGFASALRSDYEEALRVVFQDYGDSLAAVRKHLVAEKLAVEPRMQRWQELFLTLKAIEQEL